MHVLPALRVAVHPRLLAGLRQQLSQPLHLRVLFARAATRLHQARVPAAQEHPTEQRRQSHLHQHHVTATRLRPPVRAVAGSAEAGDSRQHCWQAEAVGQGPRGGPGQELQDREERRSRGGAS